MFCDCDGTNVGSLQQVTMSTWKLSVWPWSATSTPCTVFSSLPAAQIMQTQTLEPPRNEYVTHFTLTMQLITGIMMHGVHASVAADCHQRDKVHVAKQFPECKTV